MKEKLNIDQFMNYFKQVSKRTEITPEALKTMQQVHLKQIEARQKLAYEPISKQDIEVLKSTKGCKL